MRREKYGRHENSNRSENITLNSSLNARRFGHQIYLQSVDRLGFSVGELRTITLWTGETIAVRSHHDSASNFARLLWICAHPPTRSTLAYGLVRVTTECHKTRVRVYIVVNWYGMLCHTQYIHNIAWSEQWSGTASPLLPSTEEGKHQRSRWCSGPDSRKDPLVIGSDTILWSWSVDRIPQTPITIGSSDRENTKPNSLLPIESRHKSFTGKFRIEITWSWLNKKRQTDYVYSWRHNGRCGDVIYEYRYESVMVSLVHAHSVCSRYNTVWTCHIQQVCVCD